MNVDPNIVPTSDKMSSAALIRVLGLIALISGLLIVLVYQWTLPIITEYHRQELEQAVLTMIPAATSMKPFVVDERGMVPEEQGAKQTSIRVYAGYDDDGKLKGIAAEGAARGYADVIRLLYGYSPETETINGIRIVSHRETPGFGDKMATDPGFQANFNALDARLNPENTGLVHPITTVKHGTKRNPWEIDAISGATVSSRGAGKALNDSAQKVLPEIAKRLDELRGEN